MKRIIEIIGKNGVIDIYGNPLETIFYLRGKPIQYSWFAEVVDFLSGASYKVKLERHSDLDVKVFEILFRSC